MKMELVLVGEFRKLVGRVAFITLWQQKVKPENGIALV